MNHRAIQVLGTVSERQAENRRLAQERPKEPWADQQEGQEDMTRNDNMSGVDLTMRHDYDEGTRVEGTTKGGRAHRVLKEHRSWVWAPSVGAWLLRGSRRRAVKRGKVEEMVELLRSEGYAVAVELDEAMPDMPQREADEQQAAEDNADRLAVRARRATAAANASHERARSHIAGIPPGQPVLVGHHSQPRHERDLARHDRDMRKAIDQGKHAEELSRRAEQAQYATSARYAPQTVGNRIDKLVAEQRDLERRVAGDSDSFLYATDADRDRWRVRLGELADELAYWRGVRVEQLESGKAVDTSGVERGDWIAVRGKWAPVRKVNRKTFTIPNLLFPAPQSGEREHTRTIERHKVTDYRKACDVDPDVVAAFDQPRDSRG